MRLSIQVLGHEELMAVDINPLAALAAVTVDAPVVVRGEKGEAKWTS